MHRRSGAEQTLISSWKQKQPWLTWMVAVVNMSKQRGTCTNPPFENTERMPTQKHTQHAEDEMRFIIFLKGKRTCKQRQRQTEECKVTCNMQFRGKKKKYRG